MSLLDKASLIVTPNAYKESKLYSVVPSSGAGDMDVVRATTATRVNSAGLIEVVPRNLLQYSEQFDNAAWIKINGTISANAILAPNNITTADKFIEDSANGQKYILQQYPTSLNERVTFSSYIKPDGRNFVRYGMTDGISDAYVDVNLTTKATANLTTGGSWSSGSVSVTDAANGFLRISFTATKGAGTSIFPIIFLCNTLGNSSYLGNGTSGVYLWGSQLETSSTATEYFPTTTRLNIPRIDYTNGSCPSLLVEPQRTNLALYSEQFDNAAWIKKLSTVTANSIISPDGTQNADTINVTSGTYAGLYQVGNLTSNIFTMSVFAKKGTKQWLYFVNLTGANAVAWFDLNNGTVGNVIDGTATIKDFGNGWYKCTYTNTSNILNTYLQLGFSEGNNSVTISSNGTAYIYGAQLEVGSYSTSYIPTVASSVTRNADVISKTGISSLIGQTEGTLFADVYITIKKEDTSPVVSILALNNNVTNVNNAIVVGIDRPATGTVNQIYAYVVNGGTEQVVLNTSAITNGRYKIAFAYKANDFVLYVNGVQIGTDTSGSVPTCSQVLIGERFNSDSFKLADSINSSQLYKTRLTNTELAQLTTL